MFGRKRIFGTAGLAVIAAVMLAACGGGAEAQTSGAGNATAQAAGTQAAGGQSTGAENTAAAGSTGKAAEGGAGTQLHIVTTIFPAYDWVREISGNADNVDITMLLGNGTDMHSYQPSVADIMKIADCDLFIYTGGESEAWVKDAIANAKNPDMEVLSLMDTLGDRAKEEEILEGMQAEEEHEGHTGEHAEEHDHEDTEEPEYDEHVWLSLKNAEICVGEIAARLSELDPEDTDTWSANAAAYTEKLKDLDGRFRAAADSAPLKTVIFGDRYPFRYLLDDYGLSCYAAFPGCSAETEASFETIVFLAGKADELGTGAILTIENSDGKIARTITENTKTKDQEILVMNSMQSVTDADAAAGTTYLGIMEENLRVLGKALGSDT